MTLEPKMIEGAANPEPPGPWEEVDRVYQAAQSDLDHLVWDLGKTVLDESALNKRMIELARLGAQIGMQYEFARGAAQEAGWFLATIECDDEGKAVFQKRLTDWQAKVAELQHAKAVCAGRAAECREYLARLQAPTHYEVSAE